MENTAKPASGLKKCNGHVYSGDPDFKALLGSFEQHKAYAALVASAMAEIPEFSKKEISLENCGTYLELDGDGILVASNLCRERLCPLCQWRRSLRVYGQTQKILDRLEPDGYAYLHLVLTIPNCKAADLYEQIGFLFRRSSALFSDRLYPKGDQLARHCHFKRAFRGVLRALEVTYNRERDDYHPHLHCLVAVRPSYFTGRDYVSRDLMRLLWTGYAAPLYDLDRLTLFQVYMARIREGERNNAVAEVAKYAVKPFHMELDLDGYRRVLPVLHRALRGRRLLQLYGCIAQAARELRIDLNNDEEAALTGGATRKFYFAYGHYHEVKDDEKEEPENRKAGPAPRGEALGPLLAEP